MFWFALLHITPTLPYLNLFDLFDTIPVFFCDPFISCKHVLFHRIILTIWNMAYLIIKLQMETASLSVPTLLIFFFLYLSNKFSFLFLPENWRSVCAQRKHIIYSNFSPFTELIRIIILYYNIVTILCINVHRSQFTLQIMEKSGVYL